MLLIGGFTIAAALSKHFIAKSLASLALSRIRRPSLVILANMGIAAFASMWISNVAAPVLCFSLAQPILRNLPAGHQFPKALVMGTDSCIDTHLKCSPSQTLQLFPHLMQLQNIPRPRRRPKSKQKHFGLPPGKGPLQNVPFRQHLRIDARLVFLPLVGLFILAIRSGTPSLIHVLQSMHGLLGIESAHANLPLFAFTLPKAWSVYHTLSAVLSL